jgi:hypothetical protein
MRKIKLKYGPSAPTGSLIRTVHVEWWLPNGEKREFHLRPELHITGLIESLKPDGVGLLDWVECIRHSLAAGGNGMTGEFYIQI